MIKYKSCGGMPVGFIILLFCIHFISPLSADETDLDNIIRTQAMPEKKIYLDLEKSLGIAITNNFQLKSINVQGKLQDLTILERWRDYFPVLSLSYMKSDEIKINETDINRYRLSADASIVIYDGGKRGLNYDIEKLKSILARNDYRIALNKTIMDVSGLYLDVLKLKDSVKIYKKTHELGLVQLNFINRELQLGEATKFDVMEIGAKVKEMELNYEKAKNDYLSAINKFKIALKINWQQPLGLLGSIIDDISLKPIGDSPVDKYISMALKNRKEIESSRVELEINTKTYTINKLYYFPQFSFGMNYSISDDKYLPREKEWGVSLKVTTALFGNTGNLDTNYKRGNYGNTRAANDTATINVLDSMSYRRKILESRLNMDSASQNYKDIKEQISIDIINSLTSLKNSWKMIQIAKQQLELYDLQLVIERLKANLGESRRYDLMKKEIERGEAAIAYLDSRVKNLMSILSLESAMGVDLGYLGLYKMNFKSFD